MTDITNLPDIPSQVLPGRMMLEDLFSGDENKRLREEAGLRGIQ